MAMYKRRKEIAESPNPTPWQIAGTKNRLTSWLKWNMATKPLSPSLYRYDYGDK